MIKKRNLIHASAVLMAFALVACQSIPPRIDDSRLSGMTTAEANDIESQKTSVVNAKHVKDAERRNESLERQRVLANRAELLMLKVEPEKSVKERELETNENHLEISEKKTDVATLELSYAIATLEALKARIVAAKPQYATKTEDYENTMKKIAGDLKDEKLNLAQLEKGRMK
jgi:hypothetical protein